MSQLFKFGPKKQPPASRIPQPGVPDSKMEMDDEIFARLRDTIYNLCGIYYTESKKYLLEGRILKRIAARNLKSFEDYLSLLNSPAGRTELNDLFEAITINETYFFRAPQQFTAFEEVVAPEIIENKKGLIKPVFKIWSAAASTGEEAYTLAILIKEKLQPKFPNVTFQIFGSDINNQVLEKAKTGIYKEYAIRNMPPEYLKKYFIQSGNTYALKDDIKRMVKFANLNLYDEHSVRSLNNCDIIFCANVLIYFDIPSKQKLVSNLYDTLNKG
ncbi:MAG: CheR family methyltransferase, partial [Bacteroidota bacterium]